MRADAHDLARVGDPATEVLLGHTPYLAGSTIWVHRNKAIWRPVDSFVMVASQT
jgi:hypothetical protein